MRAPVVTQAWKCGVVSNGWLVFRVGAEIAEHHHHHDQSSAVWRWSTWGSFSSIASWLSVSCLKTGFKCVTASTLPPPVCSEDPALWQSEAFLLYLDPAMMMSPQTWHLWVCWICSITMPTAKLISHFPASRFSSAIFYGNDHILIPTDVKGPVNEPSMIPGFVVYILETQTPGLL